jgi:hypothetical protein
MLACLPHDPDSAGGGRKIIRCEISLDLGVTWRLAEIRRFEEPTEYGESGKGRVSVYRRGWNIQQMLQSEWRSGQSGWNGWALWSSS